MKQQKTFDVVVVVYVCACMAGYCLFDKGHDAFMSCAVGFMGAFLLPGMVLCWLLGQPFNWGVAAIGSLAFWVVVSWLAQRRRSHGIAPQPQRGGVVIFGQRRTRTYRVEDER